MNTIDDWIYLNSQPYKYSGKELDTSHGLNLYDSSARLYDGTVPRFTTVDPHAENYFSWSPYAYCGNNPIRIIDPTGMDWYFHEESGGLYFVREVSDEKIQYGGANFTRIGGNDMMGDMGDITEKIYDLNASRELAEVNGYTINPTEQVIQKVSTTILDNKSPAKGDTGTQYTVVNEKYGLFSAKETYPVTIKVELLESDYNFLDMVSTVVGAARKDFRHRLTSTYSDLDKGPQPGAASPDYRYDSLIEYPSWQSYYRDTKGKGKLLKHRKNND